MKYYVTKILNPFSVLKLLQDLKTKATPFQAKQMLVNLVLTLQANFHIMQKSLQILKVLQQNLLQVVK